VTKDPANNPIAQACADLARRAPSDASLSGNPGAQRESERMLEELGCLKDPKNSN
jgi:hypothetical protein